MVSSELNDKFRQAWEGQHDELFPLKRCILQIGNEQTHMDFQWNQVLWRDTQVPRQSESAKLLLRAAPGE